MQLLSHLCAVLNAASNAEIEALKTALNVPVSLKMTHSTLSSEDGVEADYFKVRCSDGVVVVIAETSVFIYWG